MGNGKWEKGNGKREKRGLRGPDHGPFLGGREGASAADSAVCQVRAPPVLSAALLPRVSVRGGVGGGVGFGDDLLDDDGASSDRAGVQSAVSSRRGGAG